MLKSIEFQKPPSISTNCKATIHISGKLGFSSAAISLLDLKENKYIKIGVNKEDKGDNNLYIMVQKGEDEETVPVSKAGDYFYAGTKALFEKMGIDYHGNKKIIYDVKKVNIEGVEIFKFIRRDVDRKKGKNSV